MNKINFNIAYKHLLVITSIIVLAVIITSIFPIFFRTDDVTPLYWCAHHSFKDIFNVQLLSLWGFYRPVGLLFFIINYKLFGLNPIGYQFACTSIFFIDLYLMYIVSKVYFNKKSAITTLIVYIALFYNHFQMIFWFSDIVFIMHMMFTLLAILFYIKSKANIYFIIGSFLFALLGTFTKEPSIVIVIAFVIGDYLSDLTRKDYLKKAWILTTFIGIFIFLLLTSPVIGTRFNNSPDHAIFLSNLDYRYRYYFDCLLSGTKLIIPLVLSLTLAVSIKKSWYLKLLVLTLCIPCYYYPYYYLFLLFGITGYFTNQYKKLLPLFFWMLGTSLTLPFMEFITPSYLFEFSFGFSLFIGYVINSQLIEKFFIHFRINHNKLFKISLIGITVISAPIASKLIISQINALNLVVETRKNFSKGIDYIHNNKNNLDYIVIPDQEKSQSYEEKSKIAIRSNEDKAKFLKTMNAYELKTYLTLINCGDLNIIPYTEYIKSPIYNHSVILLIQNDTDIKFATENNLKGESLFEYSYSGKNRINIISIQTNNKVHTTI